MRVVPDYSRTDVVLYLIREGSHSLKSVTRYQRVMTESPIMGTFIEDASSSAFQSKSKLESSLHYLHIFFHSSSSRSILQS
jgi:hypothetical protein